MGETRTPVTPLGRRGHRQIAVTRPGVLMRSTRYELRIRGRLSDDLRTEFSEFVATEAPTETVLRGEIVDDAHLHGVLARCRALGLQITSLRADTDLS
jgi:hypothetical protein